jgi:hypothetical protein
MTCLFPKTYIQASEKYAVPGSDASKTIISLLNIFRASARYQCLLKPVNIQACEEYVEQGYVYGKILET